MIDSEAALIARVVAHDDRAAFELLVRRYQSPVRNFLRRLTAWGVLFAMTELHHSSGRLPTNRIYTTARLSAVALASLKP